MRRAPWRPGLLIVAGLLAAMLLPVAAAAQVPPVVKTVPWVASNPLIPHDTWSGKQVVLKGTSSVQGSNIQYTWDYGDGSPVSTGTVTNRFVIQSWHTYTGTPGTVFTARLTVLDTTTGLSDSQPYYVEIRELALPVEVNVAIDTGLWYLHSTMYRSTGADGFDRGSWTESCGGYACYGVPATTGANVHAFFVNGHREDGADSNPYTETVQRAMRRLVEFLSSNATALKTYGNGLGIIDPDCAGCAGGDPADNGVALSIGNDVYQTGIVTDAIAASGVPSRMTVTGTVGTVRGRTYRAILQDLVDYWVFGQEYRQGCSGFGSWRYGAQYCSGDNSTAQWGAIGLMAAKGFGRLMYGPPDPGIQIPDIVLAANRYWLTYSFQSLSLTQGAFGYDGPGSYAWGQWATTPSGLVQLAMTGQGRGGTDTKWEKTEGWIRDNFANTGGAYYALKDYYYGLFAFVKAMLLHDAEPGDGVPDPIQFLHSGTGGLDIDWYSAQVATGDPTNGVARTLVDDQGLAGYWYGHNYNGAQYYFETAWAIIMLNRTIFETGAPVAVIEATPNPAVAGQAINLSGAASFHQDAAKMIDSWAWDLNNDGTYETPGLTTTVSYPAIGSYIVGLQVSDNGVPERFAWATVTLRVTTPPVAPTANAAGPYSFCANRTPWFLDGRGSSNPDDGQSEPGMPPDVITAFNWDLNGDGVYTEAVGATPDVTAYFGGRGPGSYLIQLRVTDNTAASFPSSGFPNLNDTDSAVVVVRAATDPVCGCTSDLAARPKLTKVQLTWTPSATVHHWNVFRGVVNGGPYLKIGEVPGTLGTFLDNGPLTIGATYYYVIRETLPNQNEVCQSNQAAALVRAR